MKSYHQKFISDHPYESVPMAEISGFPVRPGIYDLNGATPLQNGVNFTIHTHACGTSCELLLFHRAQEEPFAVIPFPEAYKIGDVYSMIVYRTQHRRIRVCISCGWSSSVREKGLLFDQKQYPVWILMQELSQDSVRGEIRWDHNYHARSCTATVLTGVILHSLTERAL